jgi:hypothetical protein
MTDGIILVVFSVILLLILVVLANALAGDAGFVLMVWHHWQVQTSVGFAMLLIVMFSLALIILFFVIRAVLFSSEYFYQKRKAKTRRKTLMSLDTAIRHRLVADDAGSFLAMEDSLTHNSLNLRPFNKKKGSALHLLQAEVACRAGFYEAANQHLMHIDSDDYELATLLRVKIYLASGDFLQAKSALELLIFYPEQHVTELVRASLQPHFDHQVGELWSRLAAEIPWQMLSEPTLPAQQDNIDWNLWLQALLTHELPETAAEDVLRLLQLMAPEIQDQHANALFTLLIYARAEQRAFMLAELTLTSRLDIPLLSHWMDVCIHHSTQDVAQSVERVLLQLEQRYPSQPDIVLARVRWMRSQLTAQPINLSEQNQAVLDLLKPFQNHALIQHYQLIWQLEDHTVIDEHLRSALLDNLRQ